MYPTMVGIVAELSINHLGMHKIAEVMIRRLAEFGVSYIKLKKKDVGAYYKPGKKYKGYDFITYRNSFELNMQDFVHLDETCRELGIGWFSTIHGPKSFEFISNFEVPFYKVASMDAREPSFIDWLIQANESKTPMIISTGGLNIDYIEKMAREVLARDIPLVMNHCVSIYPTEIEQTNMHKVLELRKRLEPMGCIIGYSGHEIGWVPTLMSILYGAKLVERHVALSRDIHIHHINAALTIDEFGSMVSDIRDLETLMLQNPLDTHLQEIDFLEERKYE